MKNQVHELAELIESELLDSTHQKNEFHCGEHLLDGYLHHQASQDVRRKLSACFVISEPVTNRVKGYYTLSNLSLSSSNLPEQLVKKYPNAYSQLPVTLLGRLARDHRYTGERLGERLLLDAFVRSYLASHSVGSMAIIVDPIHDQAKNFYLAYGFIELINSPKMFISMKTVAQLF